MTDVFKNYRLRKDKVNTKIGRFNGLSDTNPLVTVRHHVIRKDCWIRIVYRFSKVNSPLNINEMKFRKITHQE